MKRELNKKKHVHTSRTPESVELLIAPTPSLSLSLYLVHALFLSETDKLKTPEVKQRIWRAGQSVSLIRVEELSEKRGRSRLCSGSFYAGMK